MTLTDTYRPPAVATRIGEIDNARTEFTLPTLGFSVQIDAAEPVPDRLSSEIKRHTTNFDLTFSSRGDLIDTITALLWRNGFDEFMVTADGAMRHHGTSGSHVALRHPGGPDLAIGVATITEQALCARTDGTTATWVVAQEATTADDLCAALADTAPVQLHRYFNFSYVRLFHDGAAEISRNFPGVLFAQH